MEDRDNQMSDLYKHLSISATAPPTHHANPVVDTEIDSFMRNLKTMWLQCKKCQALQNMLHNQFYRLDRPFEKVLTMVRQSDYRTCVRVSLAYTVMEEFTEWIKQVGPSVYDHLTLDNKEEAFQVACRQTNRDFSKLIVNTYKLTEDNEFFLPHLNNMLKLYMYPEVCNWSVLLGLERHFTVMQLLIPLLLLDKYSLVEGFVKKCPSHNLDLVKFLDNLIDEDAPGDKLASLAGELDIPDVKTGTLMKYNQHKTLMKVINKLKSLHNISDDETPNTTIRHCIRSINFLVYNRYVKFYIGKDGFREMVIDAIKNRDSKTITHLITKLCKTGDVKEAAYWASYYKVDIEQLPSPTKDLIVNASEYEEVPAVSSTPSWWEAPVSSTPGFLEPDENSSSIPDGFYQMPIAASHIHFIQTEEQFTSLIASAVDGSTVLGLDCEWKPKMTGGQSVSQLSLIQIASRVRVYILDVILLQQFTHLWKEFVTVCLANPMVTKLGYGLRVDLRMMSKSLPSGELLLSTKNSFLDLQVLWTRLAAQEHLKLPFTDSHVNQGQGLSNLVAMCFGKSLNKTEQFSNWECRPLRESQVIYAATDAYCLLDVYDTMLNLCLSRNIPFDDIKVEVMAAGTKTTSKNKSSIFPDQPMDRLKTDGTSWNFTYNSIKIYCGPGLKKLGEKCRMAGIDTEILPTTGTEGSWVKAVAESLSDRILVLKTAHYKDVEENCPHITNVFIVAGKSPMNQLAEVLNYFNVLVTNENFLSRCACCNSCDMMKTTSEEISSKLNSTKSSNYTPAGDEDDDDDDDYFVEDSYQTEKYSNPTIGTIAQPWVTSKNCIIDVFSVPSMVLSLTPDFVVCNDCGKIYWNDGSFKSILETNTTSHWLSPDVQ